MWSVPLLGDNASASFPSSRDNEGVGHWAALQKLFLTDQLLKVSDREDLGDSSELILRRPRKYCAVVANPLDEMLRVLATRDS